MTNFIKVSTGVSRETDRVEVNLTIIELDGPPCRYRPKISSGFHGPCQAGALPFGESVVSHIHQCSQRAQAPKPIGLWRCAQ